VVARDLVKNALRMRPDRIIVGEVRSAEALDMLQAMNTGHEGSLTTVHANSPRDALARLETMILMAGTNLPNRAMREQISSALDVIVQTQRLADGVRRITSIVEVTGMEGEVVTTQEVFRYRRRGVTPEGKIIGQFEATGIRPMFTERLRIAGIDVPARMFDGEE
jgi:pilus assembly protein CpaF